MNKQYWLDYLNNPSSPVITGQHLSYYTKDYDDGYRDYFEASQTTHNKMPYMPGLTIGNGSTTEQSKEALLFLSQKGFTFLNIDHHPMNPWTGGNSWDTTVVDMPNLNTNQVWLLELARIKDILLYAKQLGIVCLWRPLHEMNADKCFWWDLGSSNRSVVPFKKAWEFMYNYLSDVDNLIWEYCPMNMGWSDVYIDMCPPTNQFDVVGLDLYSNSATISKDGYTKLLSLGKPIGFGEAGPSDTGPADAGIWSNACKKTYPLIKFIQFWHSWDTCSASIIDATNVKSILCDKYFLSRESLIKPIVPASISLYKTNPLKATISWSYPEAQLVSISGIGNVPTTGKKAVSLVDSTKYEITATVYGIPIIHIVNATSLLEVERDKLTVQANKEYAKLDVIVSKLNSVNNILKKNPM